MPGPFLSDVEGAIADDAPGVVDVQDVVAVSFAATVAAASLVRRREAVPA